MLLSPEAAIFTGPLLFWVGMMLFQSAYRVKPLWERSNPDEDGFGKFFSGLLLVVFGVTVFLADFVGPMLSMAIRGTV